MDRWIDRETRSLDHKGLPSLSFHLFARSLPQRVYRTGTPRMDLIIAACDAMVDVFAEAGAGDNLSDASEPAEDDADEGGSLCEIEQLLKGGRGAVFSLLGRGGAERSSSDDDDEVRVLGSDADSDEARVPPTPPPRGVGLPLKALKATIHLSFPHGAAGAYRASGRKSLSGKPMYTQCMSRFGKETPARPYT